MQEARRKRPDARGETQEARGTLEAGNQEPEAKSQELEARSYLSYGRGRIESEKMGRLRADFGPVYGTAMEVLTEKFVRRSTRIRVEIPVSVISLDRRRPFGEKCTVVIVSAQGCGFRASEELQVETPIMLSGLPGGGSVTARVANCLPLGSDGKYFLIGASLYTHGNVWGIENPPADWGAEKDAKDDAVNAPGNNAQKISAPKINVQKQAWPYNVFSEGSVKHPGRK